MGSQIEVESNPGDGSTFYFNITCSYSKDKTPDKKDKTPIFQQQSSSKAVSVLIVDDVALNLKLARVMVQKILPNAKFFTAHDGMEALEIYKEKPIDLVLMDIQMPRMDGYAAARVIRLMEKKANLQTPIIALTAGVTEDDKQACFDVGMNDFLSKPIQYKELHSILLKYIYNI